jgi:oxygen-independent coproporphyrinogen III oxidase
MNATTHADLDFDPALIARYDAHGPRYTSYPTAPHFAASFDEATYRVHAAATNDDPIPRPLSLYLHMPFCASPCFYCGCNRVITRDRAKGDAYLERLYREIALQGALFDRDRRVVQLHLGGGTPNFYDVAQFEALFDALGAAFRLAGPREREFSIELDPRHANRDYVKALAALGFNRASLGVQDFDHAVQVAINRVQSVKETREVIDATREAGFDSVSVDLIYGLPKQNLTGFGRTLDTVVEAAPDRIALYSYAHLPELFKAQRQIAAADLPAPHDKLALLGLAIEKLGAAGYRYIGMDHFARADDELARALDERTLQRNFQGYSTHADCDLVGLGVSAIGKVGDCYAQNARDLVGYYAALDTGRLAIAKGLVLAPDDELRAAVIQDVMCRGEIEFRAFEWRYGIEFASHFARELERLSPLVADGLVEIRADGLRVTPRGRLLVRLVAMAFDAYLARPGEVQARYSRVV